jgi:hypothetical protein
MFKNKHPYRKPDPLLLLTLLVGMALLMTSAVDAAESLNNTMSLSDLKDGEIIFTPVGRHGATMNMSYQSNPYLYEPTKTRLIDVQQLASSPTFFLSVRVPW